MLSEIGGLTNVMNGKGQCAGYGVLDRCSANHGLGEKGYFK
jgi:hypothetical protein